MVVECEGRRTLTIDFFSGDYNFGIIVVAKSFNLIHFTHTHTHTPVGSGERAAAAAGAGAAAAVAPRTIINYLTLSSFLAILG